MKDHRDTGSLANLLALWGFVDDSTFLTKAGAVGVAFRLHGVDDDCLDHEQRRAVTVRFEQALRQLDESCRVYQYFFKDLAQPVELSPASQPVVREALRRRESYLEGKTGNLFAIESFLVVIVRRRSSRLRAESDRIVVIAGYFGRPTAIGDRHRGRH